MSCAVCGNIENLQEHHLNYNPEVKIFLCLKHHNLVHKHGTGLGKGEKKTSPKFFNPKTYIKPHGYITVTKRGQTSVPTLIRKALPFRKIPFILCGLGVFMYEPKAKLEEIVKSLEIANQLVPLRKNKSTLLEVLA